MVKVDIYEEGRFKGTLRVNDKWHGMVLTEEQIREEIETRLPTLKHSKYTIAFH
jgi:hypothetical protein